MKWLIKRYMVDAHIDSLADLSNRSGIAKRTLYDRINSPHTLKIYELMALDKVLHFSNEDLVMLAKGKIEGD